MEVLTRRAGSFPICAVNSHGIAARNHRDCQPMNNVTGFAATRFQTSWLQSCRGGRQLRTWWCCSVPGDSSSDETVVSKDDLESTAQVETFCRLPLTVPWGAGEVASTMFIFWAGFHIPLGLAGLDLVAKFIPPEQFVDPQTQAVLLVFVQLIELAGTIWLIQSTLQPFEPLPPNCLSFRFDQTWKNRGWLPASLTALLVLSLAVAATATLTQGVSPTEVSNQASPSGGLASLLQSNTLLGRVAIYIAYCGLTPCIEEYVYRGFLLSSLRTYMTWPVAVLISALVFSGSHVSAPGFVPLFFVGCCLGTAYSWNANLATSFVIHSVYNALVLTQVLLH